jgi:hypothetical protein
MPRSFKIIFLNCYSRFAPSQAKKVYTLMEFHPFFHFRTFRIRYGTSKNSWKFTKFCEIKQWKIPRNSAEVKSLPHKDSYSAEFQKVTSVNTLHISKENICEVVNSKLAMFSELSGQDPGSRINPRFLG